ncbi:uncharacterized protein N7459_001796 [Penicillium hispanicum]|uniref:uncharacterized protein n=1 Tax=Penicillium hispanicum TaxID=1080232 RepID=UPI00253FD1AF|nr:uncharacterized protein N7459_001796 [Penicillium hispanicum]KAJ5595588.1 hypothetical protein N7459_001796 [Penicillium hispanicum]
MSFLFARRRSSSESQTTISRLKTNGVSRRETSKDRSRSSSASSAVRAPGSPESPSAVAHGEPKQPGNIQDYLELRLDESSSHLREIPDDAARPPEGEILTKKDIKAILSGAPHFLLERGKHGRWYPQVIFPWDEHNPSIQRMLDRKPLPHPSFTLCTLHAHLPVPDDWAVKGGVPRSLHDWRRTGACKRATFDVGVFEVPNMLANNGREPGTVGFRHFLELAVADMVRYTGPEQPRESPNMQRLSSLPATEAFELMDNYTKPYSQCQSGAVFDRRRLIQEGPAAWKRIGVRDINLRTLVHRLNQLRQLRLEVLRDGSTITITDVETPHELHNILHTNFLQSHPPPVDLVPGHPESLKSQIKTLATVLDTPGAWIDFSLPEWRFRAGQILWEAPPHSDGDCIASSVSGDGKPRGPWVNPGMERKWLLVQLLLAAELIFRLDAFVRVGMLHDPHGGLITAQELHHFDKLREGKVNWDLIVVRRFLDNLEITCESTASGDSSVGPGLGRDKVSGKPRRFSLFDSISRRVSSTTVPDLRSAWQCQIGSSHVRQQLEGLYVFAENIGWPRIHLLKAALEEKLRKGNDFILPALDTEGCPGPGRASMEPLVTNLVKGDMYSRSQSLRCVKLRSTCPEHGDPHAFDTLGWISRSWLSGLVIPGESISHLLIGTLLENDADALRQLGPTVNLHGGFVLGDHSWWSKACIIGRVLASLEGARTCMGWVGSNVPPRDANTLETWGDGWLEIPVLAMSVSSGRPRIKHGAKLALESSPLGMGDITAETFTLPTDPPNDRTTCTVSLEVLTLSVAAASKQGITTSDETSLSFSLHDPDTVGSPTTATFPLKYNVRFISAHECHAPRGFTSQHQNEDCPVPKDNSKTATPDCRQYKRLSAHPLHRSFPYQYISFRSLPQRPAPETVSGATPVVLVIDARGCRTKETFVRAWCASVGCHAIIGRTGRTCVACCVREARAMDVAVVVRVGE